MYPRGRKVCFATAGFLLIAKTRIYLRSCGIPTGKKRAGLACGIGNILRAGRPSGGQPSFPGRLAGRREAAAKRGTGNAPWRRRKEGRRGGRRCFAGPAGRQNQSRGRGRRPPPLWLSKKWLAPLFRGFHSSLAPTARPGSYAEKPLLRKAFCGFAVHAAKSDYSLRGLRPPNPQGFFDRLRGGGRRPPPLLWLSKKWPASLFRGVHSSLAPTARAGSYARKPLLRKAFCGFDAHPPGGPLLSLRDNSPCVAKSDQSLRRAKPSAASGGISEAEAQ